MDQAEQKLTDAFKALSAEALKSNNQSFLDLAKTSLEKLQEAAKGDLEKRQQAIGAIVEPVKLSLEKVDAKIQALETARAAAYGSLSQQLTIARRNRKAAPRRNGELGQGPAGAERPRSLGRNAIEARRRAGRHAQAIAIFTSK